VVIPIEAGDDPDSLAAKLSPMEHRLVVATVEFFARHRVECNNGSIVVVGERLSGPLQLQTDGRLEP
jgi:phosphoribosylglycinamide formyltransferase-1